MTTPKEAVSAAPTPRGNAVLVPGPELRALKDALAASEARANDLTYKLTNANAFGEQCMTDINTLRQRAEAAEQSLAEALKDAAQWRRWRAMQDAVEKELPAGYAVELYMSPGDWSLSFTDPGGKDIDIHDWDDTADFIRRAIEVAKERAAIDALLPKGEGETS